jgi:DNA-binding NtrC family response regulator
MKNKGKKILIVDDDKRILESLKVILESEGYVVETAETGQEAIKRNQNDLFDMALLDIKLPGMQGTELLAALHKESPRMVKIMMTGYPSLENAVTSLKLGADAYIMKPVNPEKLLDTVEKKLGERDMHD